MDNGTIVTEIHESIVEFYKNLYENFERVEHSDTDDTFFNNLETISGADEDSIVRPITAEELLTTLDSCSDSSPGPDGIPYSIIRHLWQVYGPILVDAWKHSQVIKTLPPSHKLSLLKLIPKVGKDLSKLTNWRPITL